MSRLPGGASAHVDRFAAAHLPPKSEWPEMRYDTLPELAAYADRLNCATELLDNGAERHGARPLFHYQGEVWTYRDLLTKANQIAHVLVDDLGIRPGNRVLIRAPNNPMYVACWFAVQKVGGVCVATMPLLRWRELTFMSEKAEIQVALCDGRLAEEMETALERSRCLERAVYFYGAPGGADGLEARMATKPETFRNVDTAADDICLIAFTSGTTGAPKGCLHCHRDILAINDTFARYVLRPRADDVFTGSPPIAFTFGLGALVTFPMSVGASTVLVEKFTPELTLETVAKHRVTILFTAPTAYRAMTDLVAGHDISSLKKCVSAGETLPLATFNGWRDATGIRIIDGIGSTEMLHIFISAAGDDIRPGATGKPIPGFEARVVDDQGLDVAPGTVGRLAVRGPTGCRYLDNPEKQAAYVQDGWNFTGDAYLKDEDGYFHFQARTDDLIVSAGYNISGPEVEAILLEHPKVMECAVVGVADDARGQIVKAFVVPRAGAQPDATLVQELQDFVKA